MAAFLLVSVLLNALGVVDANARNERKKSDLFGNRTGNELDPATIDALGDTVLDWQMANLPEPGATERPASSDRRGWVFGAMYVGMMKWAALPENDQYFDALRQICEENEWLLGDRPFNADDHIVGQLYLTFYEMDHEERMISHMIRIFDEILEAHFDQTVSLEFSRDCQVRWCWADALFMAPPAFVQLSLATGQNKYLDYADREFWNVTDFLLDPHYNLYSRDSRFFTRLDDEGNKIFWSRGNGWVYAGIVNILRILPSSHPSYATYMQLFLDMSEALATLQHANGFWRVSLLAQNAYPSPETSGTGFIMYGLAWGVNNGYLCSDAYGHVVELGWKALVSAIGNDGKLGWVQRIGAGPDEVSENDTELYGVGAFLLAAEQMIQWTKNSETVNNYSLRLLFTGSNLN